MPSSVVVDELRRYYDTSDTSQELAAAMRRGIRLSKMRRAYRRRRRYW